MSPTDYEMIEQGYDPPRITHPLENENRRLREALQPFCDAHFYFSDAGKPDDCRTGIGGITYGDFRRAVSVLADIETTRAALAAEQIASDRQEIADLRAENRGLTAELKAMEASRDQWANIAVQRGLELEDRAALAAEPASGEAK